MVVLETLNKARPEAETQDDMPPVRVYSLDERLETIAEMLAGDISPELRRHYEEHRNRVLESAGRDPLPLTDMPTAVETVDDPEAAYIKSLELNVGDETAMAQTRAGLGDALVKALVRKGASMENAQSRVHTLITGK